MLTYSGGLRVGEVVELKLEEIVSNKMVVYIKKTLREYWKKYKPGKWLFPGRDKKRHITIRKDQWVFEKVHQKARKEKNITIYTFRNSFATHLLENGIDLRYIHELLGHKSSKRTEIYTQVSNKKIIRIKNPLDQILQRSKGMYKGHHYLSLRIWRKDNNVVYERVRRQF